MNLNTGADAESNAVGPPESNRDDNNDEAGKNRTFNYLFFF